MTWAAGDGAALGAAALTAAGTAADTVRRTTVQQRIIPASGEGFRALRLGAGEPYTARSLGAATIRAGRADRRRSLAYFGQLSDFQLADEESPARVEFADPAGPPVDAAWRPWEAVNPHIDDAMIRRFNAFAPASPLAQGNGRRRAMDLTINTGDIADNQQLNETEWALQLMEGGAIDPNSGVDPVGYVHPLCPPGVPGAAEAARYTGVQDYDDYAEGTNPYFYDPDDPRGQFSSFPKYPGLMDRAQMPFTAAGLDVPSYVTFGNHDALAQGNQAANQEFEQVATGCIKPIDGQGDDFPGALSSLTPGSVAALFASDPSKTVLVPPDPRRRYVSKKQYKDVYRSGAQPDGHGFDRVDPAQEAASAGAAGYYSFRPVGGLRMISLDTVCEGGVTGPCADGNVDDPQFRWLEGELKAATRADELVILFSHHAIPSLTASVPDEAAGPCGGDDGHGHPTNPGCDLDPRSSQPIHLGGDLRELLHRFPHVIAWVAGHSHVNDVTAYPDGKGGGFWSIRTAAEADWPQQSRLVELFDNRDGTLSIFGTILDHASPATAPAAGTGAAGLGIDQLASIGRTLAYNDNQVGGRECAPNPCGEGAREDRNVELLIRDPRRSGGGGGGGAGGLERGRCANMKVGGRGRDELRGTGRGDRLLGRGSRDRILGFAAADCLLGGRGPDRLFGGKGGDRLKGQRGADRFQGDSGRDAIRGNGGRDVLSGGTGRDLLRGGLDRDLIRAADGARDVVGCGHGPDRAIVDRRDRVRGCERVRRR